MARDNYSYKKYQRELLKKKKREDKQQSKLAKKNAQASVNQEQVLSENINVGQHTCL